mmetsp:Transcript_31632/g.57548  ORF Transcript_31632/g.57548 Transcript_31632/m.57548 type:complete len:708 (-) Transcript_31632:45-2168(-)
MARGEGLGLSGFRPWGLPQDGNRHGERRRRQGPPLMEAWGNSDTASRGSGTPPPSVADSLDAGDMDIPSRLNFNDSIGLAQRQGKIRGDPGIRRSFDWEEKKPRQAQIEDDGLLKMRKLLRDCCAALRRPMSEADKWTSRLQAEWIETPEQMQALGSEGWARLGLPIGLESELQRRLKAKPGGKARGASAEIQRRPKSAQPAVSSQRRSVGRAEPGTSSKPRASSRPNWRPNADVSGISEALRRQCGNSWPSHLLSALGLQKREAVDVNSLQAALRSCGVTGVSLPQIQAAVSRAAAGAEGRGPPSAEAVVAAIHGQLKGSRAEAVNAAFDDLGGDELGHLPVSGLRRQFAALEVPAVKEGRMSAQEALQSLTRAWRGLEVVRREDFAAAHILISALYREESSFDGLVRRLWRLPAKGPSEVLAGNPEAPEPFLVGKHFSPRSPTGQALKSPPKPSRSGMDRRAELKDDFEDAGDLGRTAQIEQSIQRSSRAAHHLHRLRTALRLRGSDAIEGLARRFRIMDKRGRGKIGVQDLLNCLKEVGVGASQADVVELLRGMDVDGSGTVDFEEWLRVLRGPLSPGRQAVVREAFESLDANRDGFIELSELQARFVASKHPDVEAGRKKPREVLQKLMNTLGDGNRDGRLSLPEFLSYYEGISAGIDSDPYFAHIVRAAWGLASAPSQDNARNRQRMYEGNIHITEGGLCGR